MFGPVFVLGRSFVFILFLISLVFFFFSYDDFSSFKLNLLSRIMEVNLLGFNVIN